MSVSEIITVFVFELTMAGLDPFFKLMICNDDNRFMSLFCASRASFVFTAIALPAATLFVCFFRSCG